MSFTFVVTAANCDGGGMVRLRGRRHSDTVQAIKNVAENAQKITISKPLPWNAANYGHNARYTD